MELYVFKLCRPIACVHGHNSFIVAFMFNKPVIIVIVIVI